MALDFNGATDTVDYGDVAGLDLAAALTWMFWLNIDSNLGSNDPALTKSTTILFAYRPTGDQTNFATGQSGVFEKKTTNGNAGTGTWGHWSFVYDGSLAAASRLKIYFNGVAQTMTGSDPGTTLADAGATTLRVCNLGGFGRTDGKMSDLKIWTAALTAAQIESEVHVNRPQRTANLLIWSPYDDDTNAKDYSGNGNHGTLTAATSIQGPPISYGGR